VHDAVGICMVDVHVINGLDGSTGLKSTRVKVGCDVNGMDGG